jgi:hypothetical protein
MAQPLLQRPSEPLGWVIPFDLAGARFSVEGSTPSQILTQEVEMPQRPTTIPKTRGEILAAIDQAKADYWAERSLLWFFEMVEGVPALLADAEHEIEVAREEAESAVADAEQEAEEYIKAESQEMYDKGLRWGRLAAFRDISDLCQDRIEALKEVKS